MRVFLDANVLFTAAHNPKGKSAFVVELAACETYEILTCELAIEEARRNLNAKYPVILKSFELLIKKVSITNTILNQPCPINLPLKDQPIFMSALFSESSHLLTGDLKHFGRYFDRKKETGGVLIQTPGKFLETL